jgi:hypothetical protein
MSSRLWIEATDSLVLPDSQCLGFTTQSELPNFRMLYPKKIRPGGLGLCLVAMVCFTLSGCISAPKTPPPNWGFDRSRARVSNEFFEASIDVLGKGSQWNFEGLSLYIVNKSNSDLEVDWNKTLFLDQGQTSGGFMFEGIVYSQRNQPKPPDIVLEGGSLSKAIYPNNRVEYLSGGTGRWYHWGFEAGQYGVSLAISVNGKTVRENLTIGISKQ